MNDERCTLDHSNGTVLSVYQLHASEASRHLFTFVYHSLLSRKASLESSSSMSFQGQALQRAWHLVDASNQTVGRLAQHIAQILKGKHKPTFQPNKDMGDHVVVINAEKVSFSGDKWKSKLYRWHTGYPGGLKQRRAEEMLERKPEDILKKAVLGMLKRNNLRHQSMETRLRIYTGPEHPHTAQLPSSTPPIPRVPRAKSGDFHFGLQSYTSQKGFLPK